TGRRFQENDGTRGRVGPGCARPVLSRALRVVTRKSVRKRASSRAPYSPTPATTTPNVTIVSGPTRPIHAFGLRLPAPERIAETVLKNAAPPIAVTMPNQIAMVTGTNGFTPTLPEIAVPSAERCIEARRWLWNEFR